MFAGYWVLGSRSLGTALGRFRVCVSSPEGKRRRGKKSIRALLGLWQDTSPDPLDCSHYFFSTGGADVKIREVMAALDCTATRKRDEAAAMPCASGSNEGRRCGFAASAWARIRPGYGLYSLLEAVEAFAPCFFGPAKVIPRWLRAPSQSGSGSHASLPDYHFRVLHCDLPGARNQKSCERDEKPAEGPAGAEQTQEAGPDQPVSGSNAHSCSVSLTGASGISPGPLFLPPNSCWVCSG